MRGVCTICTDYFGKDQNISATHCGHTFHEACLSRWLKQCGTHWTCPHCRTKQTQKQLVWKLYFDTPETEDNELDVYSLKNQLNECQSSEQKLKTDKKKLKEAAKQLNDEKECLKAVNKTLEKDLKEAKHTSDFLKEQLKMAKETEGEAIQAQNEAKRLRERLKICEKMEFILEGQKSRVDEMIQQYTSGSNVPTSVKQLATFCAALKQEYENIKTSRNKAKDEIMKTKKEVHKLNQQLMEKSTTCELLEESVTNLQITEEQLTDENKSLRRKLKVMQNAISSPSDTRASVISRLLAESPAPRFMTPDVGTKADSRLNKRLSSETDIGSPDIFKKPKLSPSNGSGDFIDLVGEDDFSGSFVCEPSMSKAKDKKIIAMRERTNTESPGTQQTKKVCQEMGLKFVKTTSSIKIASSSKSEFSSENFFRKPAAQLSGFPLKRTTQANKCFPSSRTNKVPMSSKAKPFSSKPMPTSSLRPKFDLIKKSGAR